MAYYKVVIEVLVDVANENEACDAISEAIRPMLQEFGADGSAWVDWHYHESCTIAVRHSGHGFEYTNRLLVGTK